MIDTINRNMLRHHVAHTMFCPHCAQVLDVRTAVSVDLSKDGELLRTWILCAKDYDTRKLALSDFAVQGGYELTVLDGRVLFARRTTRRTA